MCRLISNRHYEERWMIYLNMFFVWLSAAEIFAGHGTAMTWACLALNISACFAQANKNENKEEG
jgi:hypothetical protein